ncbi:MAG: formylglycine-generating enzyme family protein, partial [Gammaproteobacteria bacterium]|nr:formylglycine-generating enzyme family protein [Gammaproteobacteria bacterium]
MPFRQTTAVQAANPETVATSCLSDASSGFGSQVWIEGGLFIMGDDSTYSEEAPAHGVTLSGFWIDSHEVTNGQFARFIADTGYITVAERQPPAEAIPSGQIPSAMSEPGSVVFRPPSSGQPLRYWWGWVPGANWRHPEGAGSTIKGRDNFPVVHVAYEDAAAYAEWAGRSLPTEAQFELVAKNRRDSS